MGIVFQTKPIRIKNAYNWNCARQPRWRSSNRNDSEDGRGESEEQFTHSLGMHCSFHKGHRQDTGAFHDNETTSKITKLPYSKDQLHFCYY
jgi:hypothetical protein